MAKRKTGGGSSSDFDPMRWWLQNRGPTDATTDRDVERSCASKNGYQSEDEARAHIAMNGLSGSLFIYHCRYCELWHLTRRPN